MTDDPNQLNRFSKRSPRLEFREVPVGCGGLVVRWASPAEHSSLVILLHCATESYQFNASLDGRDFYGTHPHLRVGPHVFGLELDKPNPAGGGGLVLCRMSVSGAELGEAGPEVFRSAPGDDWRYTTKPPPPEWIRSEFDASGWKRLAARPMPAPEYPWAYDHLTKLGVQALGPDEADDGRAVWIRRPFEVPAEEDR
jgi:hypothetical protein